MFLLFGPVVLLDTAACGRVGVGGVVAGDLRDVVDDFDVVVDGLVLGARFLSFVENLGVVFDVILLDRNLFLMTSNILSRLLIPCGSRSQASLMEKPAFHRVFIRRGHRLLDLGLLGLRKRMELACSVILGLDLKARGHNDLHDGVSVRVQNRLFYLVLQRGDSSTGPATTSRLVVQTRAALLCVALLVLFRVGEPCLDPWVL